MQDIVRAAPQLLSFLAEPSLKHLDTVKGLLDACGVAWTVNPRLVRGLDYYSHTVFEFITDELGAQGTLCGGGRYDGLFEILGGKPTPAVGWGMGIERVLELLKTQSLLPTEPSPDAFAIIPQAANLSTAMATLQTLRTHGVQVLMHAAGAAAGEGERMGSMKSQFKKADSSGARFALIFGPDELAQGCVAVKSLRGDPAKNQQSLMPLNQVAQWAAELCRH